MAGRFQHFIDDIPATPKERFLARERERQRLQYLQDSYENSGSTYFNPAQNTPRLNGGPAHLNAQQSRGYDNRRMTSEYPGFLRSDNVGGRGEPLRRMSPQTGRPILEDWQKQFIQERMAEALLKQVMEGGVPPYRQAVWRPGENHGAHDVNDVLGRREELARLAMTAAQRSPQNSAPYPESKADPHPYMPEFWTTHPPRGSNGGTWIGRAPFTWMNGETDQPIDSRGVGPEFYSPDLYPPARNGRGAGDGIPDIFQPDAPSNRVRDYARPLNIV